MSGYRLLTSSLLLKIFIAMINNMLDLLFSSPLLFFLFILGLVVAVTIHEFSHALAADKLGDPTPRLNGRLTLNPLAHLDPLGTLSLLIARVGWGKPVPIDPYNLARPRRDAALISLAGPGSNLILAFVLSLFIRVLPSPLLATLIVPIITINVSLAIFNLLPVPPLDGAKILIGFLPTEWGVELEENLSQYGLLLLILVIFPFFGGTSLAEKLIFPVINLILSFLLPFWMI